MALSTFAELRQMLDSQRPASVLARLDEKSGGGAVEDRAWVVYRAEALLELDRAGEAQAILEAALDSKAHSSAEEHGFWRAEAGCLLAQAYLRLGWPDLAALTAGQAAQVGDIELRALALGWAAVALASKRCWGLSEQRLHEALDLAPDLPRLLAAQARVRLEADQRLEARRVYERLAAMPSQWAQGYADWGRSYVAYLLGEFEQAEALAGKALASSPEGVSPLYVLAQVALARADLQTLEEVTNEILRRSPQAQGLAWCQAELERLKAAAVPFFDKVKVGGGRRRLEAFPTLVQRRNYCGPSTVELVLRYWRDSQGLSNDQIAARFKLPQGGTPIYRMREFFYLAGFDTLRCRAPAPMLRTLIDAGYPVILQQEFSNSSHVVVAIGYDEPAGLIELQDPMTHAVSPVATEALERSRRTFLDAALVAFPQGRGHEQRLALLGVFDDAVLVWADQAVLELEHGRPLEAAELCERAVLRQPGHAFSWILLLESYLELWRRARTQQPAQQSGLAARLQVHYPLQAEPPAAARQRYLEALQRARRSQPQAEFVYHFQGEAALLDGQYAAALRAFEQAAAVDPDDARTHAARAECLYALRRFSDAVEAAWRALQLDPGQPQANAWMGRALAALEQPDAGHYAAAALDLSPELPLAALALAESLEVEGNLPAARRMAEQALALSSGESEALALNGLLLARIGEPVAAAQQLQSALEGSLPLSPAIQYRARRQLIALAQGAGLFSESTAQLQSLLQAFPEDAWGLRCQAVVRSEMLLEEGRPPEPSELAALDELFRRAVTRSAGDPLTVAEYAHYTNVLTDFSGGAVLLAELRRQYPQQPELIYLHGFYLSEAGEHAAAAQAMLEALACPGALAGAEPLLTAARCVVRFFGCREAELRWRNAPQPPGAPGNGGRRRALGLALAMEGPGCAERAMELLRQSLHHHPDDAPVLLALADVTIEDGEREALYRKALMLNPDWPQARAHLALHLTACGRARDALEFTSGYTDLDTDLLRAHAEALLAAGYYEDAAAAFARLLEQADEPGVELYAGRWEAEMRSGWLGPALQTARWALERFPLQAEWHLRLAETLRRLGRHREAAQAVARGRKRGLDEAVLLRAEYFAAAARNDSEAAAQVIENLVILQQERRQEQRGDGRLGWAESQHLRLLLEAGQIQDALNWLQSEGLDAQGWGDAAWVAMSLNGAPVERAEVTLQMAQRALALDPKNFAGMLAQAQALDDLDRGNEALDCLNSLRAAHPEEHNAYEKLALRHLAQQNLPEALELAERAVALGPFCPLAWAVRGAVNYCQGQREAALADLQAAWNRADQQRRQEYVVYWWLLHELQGEAEAAALDYRQARKQARTHLERRLLAVLRAIKL